jgi:hypothetical protein
MVGKWLNKSPPPEFHLDTDEFVKVEYSQSKYRGLRFFHLAAGLAHGFFAISTFTSFIFTFDGDDLNIPIEDYSFAWISYRCEGTDKECQSKYFYDTYKELQSDTDWQQNCFCVPDDYTESFCQTQKSEEHKNSQNYCGVRTMKSESHTAKVHLKWAFGVYFLCSFVQHIYVFCFFKRYMASVENKHRWGVRWIEYAVSAACMTVVLLAIQGGATYDGAWMGATITACTMPFGYIIECCNGILKRDPADFVASKKDDEKDLNIYEKSSVALGAPSLQDTEVSSADNGYLMALDARRVAVAIGKVALLSGFALQFFGLWCVPFIMRFYDTLHDNKLIYPKDHGCTANVTMPDSKVPLPSGDCNNAGPPDWVVVAVVGVVVFYCYFGFVMLSVHASVRGIDWTLRKYFKSWFKHDKKFNDKTFCDSLKNVFYLMLVDSLYYSVTLPLVLLARISVVIVAIPVYIIVELISKLRVVSGRPVYSTNFIADHIQTKYNSDEDHCKYNRQYLLADIRGLGFGLCYVALSLFGPWVVFVLLTNIKSNGLSVWFQGVIVVLNYPFWLFVSICFYSFIAEQDQDKNFEAPVKPNWEETRLYCALPPALFLVLL